MKKMWDCSLRFASWLLIAVMLCPLFLSGNVMAEAAADTDENFAFLYSMMDATDLDPAEGLPLESPESISESALKLYNMVDPDLVQSVFYNGPEEAAEFLVSVSNALYDPDPLLDTMLEGSVIFHAAVWSIIHADLPSEYKSRPAIKKTMCDWLKDYPSEKVFVAVDVCMDYIDVNEPELAKSGYNINKRETTISGSDEYIEYYRLGYELFEAGNYPAAIEAYVAALSFKENDNEASLEIIQAYIAMRDYQNAKEWLMKIAPYVTENNYKARWLRSYGFIAIEELDYELGYALYVYSLEFEQSQTAVQELQYIKYVAPDAREFTADEAMEYLKEKGISFAE